MKRFALSLGFLIAAALSPDANAQSYTDSLVRWQRDYKEAFTEEEGGPLTVADTGNLRFFPIGARYRVTARITQTPSSPVFDIATHTGRTRPYRQWGIAEFSLGGKKLSLRVYQSQELMKRPGFENHLAIFFNDLTNYVSTYAGGRYVDLETTDVRNGLLVLDFNKAYNPYCAYAEGYACPIPPVENRLKVEVKAGEKLYAGKHKE